VKLVWTSEAEPHKLFQSLTKIDDFEPSNDSESSQLSLDKDRFALSESNVNKPFQHTGSGDEETFIDTSLKRPELLRGSTFKSFSSSL
jgi:hypothetical protein